MIKKAPHWLWAALFFVAATVALTFPMAFRWMSSVRDFPDPALNIWLLSWNTHALFSGLDLRNAPIFYPFNGMLFLSESLLPQSLMFAPIYWLTGNAVAGHNAVLLLCVCLNGFFTYLFVSTLGCDRRAAVVSGVVYAFCPYFMRQLNHVQTVAAFGLPLFFLCVHRFFETKQARYIVGAAFSFALQSLMHGYHIVYLSYFGGLYCVARLCTDSFEWKNKKWIAPGLVAALVLAAVAGWYNQYRTTLGALSLSRWMDLAEVVGGSADLLNFLGAPPANRLYGRLLAPFMSSESALFPGVLVTLLAFAGLFWGWKKQRHVRIFLGLLCLSIVLSWGPFIRLHGQVLMKGPYWLFAEWLPGWSLVRAPGRLGVVYFFCLAVLAGFGLSFLLNRFEPKRWVGSLFAIIFAGVLLEYSSRPISLHAMSTHSNVPGIFKKLRSIHSTGPVVALPVGFHAHDTEYMYSLIPDFPPLLNGYSGYAPSFSQAFFQEMSAFPSVASLQTLQDLGVSFLIIHADLLNRIGPALPSPMLPTSFEPIESGDGWNLFQVPASGRKPTLVGMSQAEPGQIADYSLVMPVAGVCRDLAHVEFAGTQRGQAVELAARAVTKCIAGKDNLTIQSFQLKMPETTGPLHLKVTAQSSSGQLIASAERDIDVARLRADSRNPDKFRARLESFHVEQPVKAGAFCEIRVTATNTGNTTWLGDLEDDEMRAVRFRGGEASGALFDPYEPRDDFSAAHFGRTHLAIAKWRQSGTPFLVRESDHEVLTGRGYLGRDVAPGEKGEFVMRARAPDKPGHYVVRFDISSEFGRLQAYGCTWETNSATGPVFQIQVE